MSELDNDIKNLEDTVDNIIEIAKKYSIYDFISSRNKNNYYKKIYTKGERYIFNINRYIKEDM
ncbi:hypothetical protein P6439_14425 [Staphylococcus arlettae]|nr:hypothetical protein [Staphylococcus arlettae]